MRINSLTLQNFRCFDEIEVCFHQDLTVFIAPNGGGKSALLDATAVALTPFVGKTGSARGKQFHVRDSHSRLVPQSLEPGAARVPAPFQPIKLTATGEIEGEPIEWGREKRSEKGNTTHGGARLLSDYAARVLDQLSTDNAPATVLPLIAYYGTGRLWNKGPLGRRGKGKSSLPRNIGYEGCLSSGSSYGAFSSWFGTAYVNMLFGRMQAQDSGVRLEEQAQLEESLNNVRNVVRSVLEPYGACWLDYRSHTNEIVITDATRLTSLGLDQQSDGVQAIIGLAGDIASRASLLNPQFGAEAAQRTPGIVLIDEVDMHLHPRWQQQVLNSLRKAFPRVQFIVTTHSPQVLTTVNAESIRILARDTQGHWTADSPPEQTKGMENAYVMATIMGADPAPNVEEVRMLNDYIALIEEGKSETTEANSLREKLTEHFGPNHPLMLDCDRLIRFQSFKREQTSTERG